MSKPGARLGPTWESVRLSATETAINSALLTILGPPVRKQAADRSRSQTGYSTAEAIYGAQPYPRSLKRPWDNSEQSICLSQRASSEIRSCQDQVRSSRVSSLFQFKECVGERSVRTFTGTIRNRIQPVVWWSGCCGDL